MKVWIIAALLVVSLQLPANKQRTEFQSRQETAKQSPTPTSILVASALQMGQASSPPKQEGDSSEKQKSLWEKVIDAIVANWPLVVVGIPGVWIALRTLGAIKSQADLTRAELELSHRPWISVEVSALDSIVFDQRGAVLHINVKLKNVGHSVARNVSVWIDLVVDGVHDLDEFQKKVSGRRAESLSEQTDYGWLLFPDQGVDNVEPLLAKMADVEEGVRVGPFKDSGGIGLYLIGCVDYQSSFDPKKHLQTNFRFLVVHRERDVSSHKVIVIFNPKQNNPDKIEFIPLKWGASAT